MMRIHNAKGFTMIELVVVLIIIGLLSTFGFTQYLKMIENGRKAEAKSTLGAIRTFVVSRGQESIGYPTTAQIGSGLGVPTVACNSAFFYQYSIVDNTPIPPASATIQATRCASLGKLPNDASAYTITLTTDGVTGGEW